MRGGPAQACRIGHLDRPYADWPAAVTHVPADAMRLPEHGRIRVGGPANLVVLRARVYSEALSRPQADRVSIVIPQKNLTWITHVLLALLQTRLI